MDRFITLNEATPRNESSEKKEKQGEKIRGEEEPEAIKDQMREGVESLFFNAAEQGRGTPELYFAFVWSCETNEDADETDIKMPIRRKYRVSTTLYSLSGYFFGI